MIRRLVLALCALLLAPAAHAQDNLARETARVEDLRSIREIKRLQAEWGYRAMAGDWKGMAELGTYYVEMVKPGGNAEGREAVEQWLRERLGAGVDGMPAGRLNLRLWISPVITLTAMGDRAIGRWHHLALVGEAGKSAQWVGTTDEIEYHKTREGWRIAFIRPYLSFSGPYEGGWRHDAATLERVPFHYQPDEVGRLLPDREAERARTAGELAREATLLFRQGTALNLVAAYGYYLDRGMYDDIVDLFASDAAIDVAGQGTWRGHEGVRRFLGRFGAPGLDTGELNDRPQLMPLASISADGSTALVRVVELGMTGQHGGEGFWSAAVQTFLLRATAEGQWRIATMHRSPLMRASYKEGWANPLPAALPLSENLAPEGPSELASLAYPDRPYALPSFGPDLVMAAREPAGEVPILADALERAEAFDGAENVSNAYGYYIDQFAWANTAELFASNGWKELSYIGTFIGKDRVRDSMIQRYGEGGPRREFQAIHQKTQPYVTVLDGGRRAFARMRLLQFNSSSAGPGSWIGGVYENQIVKEDGVWRIHGMDLDYVWLGDYATGWTGIDPAANARYAVPQDRIDEFRPDAPLRGQVFAPYPNIAPMGFHYANPVSGREPPLRLTWSDGRRESD